MTIKEFLDSGAKGVALLETVTLHDWIRLFPGAEPQPDGSHVFAVEERVPCTLESGKVAHLLRLRRIRLDGSVSMNPADYTTRWEAPHA